jgi:hypothetical protein
VGAMNLNTLLPTRILESGTRFEAAGFLGS